MAQFQVVENILRVSRHPKNVPFVSFDCDVQFMFEAVGSK